MGLVCRDGASGLRPSLPRAVLGLQILLEAYKNWHAAYFSGNCYMPKDIHISFNENTILNTLPSFCMC